MFTELGCVRSLNSRCIRAPYQLDGRRDADERCGGIHLVSRCVLRVEKKERKSREK